MALANDNIMMNRLGLTEQHTQVELHLYIASSKGLNAPKSPVKLLDRTPHTPHNYNTRVA